MFPGSSLYSYGRLAQRGGGRKTRSFILAPRQSLVNKKVPYSTPLYYLRAEATLRLAYHVLRSARLVAMNPFKFRLRFPDQTLPRQRLPKS